MAYRTSGIVDLSTLAPRPPAPPGTSFVSEMTEQNFEQVIQKSTRHAVVVEFWSPRADNSQVSDDLRALADAAAGAFLLARVDVDAQPQIASAFGVQAVPTVMGVVGGQVAPLFQGTRTQQEMAAVIDQLLQLAAQSGIVGRAEPVAATPNADDPDAAPPHDPRFDAADALLEAGDFAGAVKEFEKVLQQTPGDRTALAGKAQAGLLSRISTLDQRAVIEAIAKNPDDVEAQLQAADIEMMAGQIEEAFDRLVRVVRDNAGADRDRARVRLLELFDTMDPTDPVVLKARRSLATALY